MSHAADHCHMAIQLRNALEVRSRYARRIQPSSYTTRDVLLAYL